jgi:hypothetical protein
MSQDWVRWNGHLDTQASNDAHATVLIGDSMVVSIRHCLWATPFSMHGRAACLQRTLIPALLSRQVEVEVFDHTLKLQQAPDSHDLGQTGELLMTDDLTAQEFLQSS